MDTDFTRKVYVESYVYCVVLKFLVTGDEMCIEDGRYYTEYLAFNFSTYGQ